MSPTQQDSHRRHAEYYSRVLHSADALFRRGYYNVEAGLRLFDLEWENIRMGQTWVADSPANNQALSELCIAYPNAGAHVLALRRHPRERIEWLVAALSAAREIGERGGEEATLNNLGNAYHSLGEFSKAIRFHEQHLSIVREIGDRSGEGSALSNLGAAYVDLGDVCKAIELFEQALVIARELSNRRGEGAAYHTLGDTRKAIEFLGQALVIDREIGDRRAESGVLENLGVAYANFQFSTNH